MRIDRSRWHSIMIGETNTLFKPPKNDSFNVFEASMDVFRSGASALSRLANEYNSLALLIPITVHEEVSE